MREMPLERYYNFYALSGSQVRFLQLLQELIHVFAFGAVHILRNAKRGRGGQLKRYQCVFHTYKSIRILTKDFEDKEDCVEIQRESPGSIHDSKWAKGD